MIAETFANEPDWIGVSPYLRAKQTAAPMQSRFPATPVVELPVQEFTYISPARCDGLTPADLKPLIDTYWNRLDPDFCNGEGAESFADLLFRAKSFLADASKRPGSGVVFTHAQFVRVVLLLVSDKDQASQADQMQSFRELRFTAPIANASVTVLISDSWRWQPLGRACRGGGQTGPRSPYGRGVNPKRR